MRANEVVRTVVGELSAHGITPQVINGGKHVHIRWKAGERDRLFVTSTSPSDIRTKLNARAEVRRMLREDGAQPRVHEPRAVKVEGGMFDIVPLLDRINKLENELATVIDLMMELQTPSVSVTVNGRPVTPSETKPQANRGTTAMMVLEALDLRQPRSIDDVKRVTSKTYASVATTLSGLGKKGLVERIGRGQWIRKAI